MSKQLQMYALLTDIERVMTQLREKLGVVAISPTSLTPFPTFVSSYQGKSSVLSSEDSVSANFCLIANGLAKLRFQHYPNQGIWRVADDSEIITVSGCDFDEKVLVRGRFYCQTDMLVGDRIVAKRSEFLGWVDRVFRLVKQNMEFSRELDAYLGEYALAWEKGGGELASLALPGREPILARMSRT